MSIVKSFKLPLLKADWRKLGSLNNSWRNWRKGKFWQKYRNSISEKNYKIEMEENTGRKKKNKKNNSTQVIFLQI